MLHPAAHDWLWRKHQLQQSATVGFEMPRSNAHESHTRVYLISALLHICARDMRLIGRQTDSSLIRLALHFVARARGDENNDYHLPPTH